MAQLNRIVRRFGASCKEALFRQAPPRWRCRLDRIWPGLLRSLTGVSQMRGRVGVENVG